jgi:hypothetical protein
MPRGFAALEHVERRVHAGVRALQSLARARVVEIERQPSTSRTMSGSMPRPGSSGPTA